MGFWGSLFPRHRQTSDIWIEGLLVVSIVWCGPLPNSIPSKPRNPCGNRTSKRIPGSHPDAAHLPATADPRNFPWDRFGRRESECHKHHLPWLGMVYSTHRNGVLFWMVYELLGLRFTTWFLIKVNASRRHQLPPAKVSVHQDPQ